MTRPDGPRPDDWRWGAWREGGPPRWGPGGRGGPRRRGFGCLFGLVFLVVAGSLVATTGFILSHAGGLAGFIALAGRRRDPDRARARACGRRRRRSTNSSRPPARSRQGSTTSGSGPSRAASARSASWSPASTRWRPASRPTSASDGPCWPRSATSSGRRWPSSRATSRRSSTASTRPTPRTSPSSSTRRASSARLIDDLRTLALSEAGTLALHREPTDPELLVSRRRSLVRGGGGHGRRGADGRHRGRPADARHRSGPDPRGPGQPRRQRACATRRRAAG